MTYRTGNHWHRHTIILEGVQPADAQGRREDDQPVAFVDSAAPDGLAERICALLNWQDREARRKPTDCPRCGSDTPHPPNDVCPQCAAEMGWERVTEPPADSCTCTYWPNGVPNGGPDPDCVVHHGRRARGPKPPALGPGCVCDGSGRACPRHGEVI